MTATAPIFSRSAGVHEGGGRLLDQLLVAALERAIALAQVDHIAVLVGQDLDLDMPRAFHQLLQVDIAIAKGRFGLAAGGGQQGRHLLQAVDLAHAFAAAAGRGLDQQREADLGRGGQQLLVQHGGRALGARHDRHAGRQHGLARNHLVAHGRDGGGLGADEDNAGIRAGRGEGLAFGQEAVTGVDGIRAALAGDLDDLVGPQIGVARRRRPEQVGLIGIADVQRVAVRLRVHGHGLDAQLAAGADDAHGDLAAVGDQHFLEHAVLLSPGRRA